MSAGNRKATALLRAAGAALLALVSALALAAGASAAPRSFYGVMPQAQLQLPDFDRMQKARVGTLRFEIPWHGIDPSAAAGDEDFSGVDALVRELAEARITPLPFLFGTPIWAAKADGGKNCNVLDDCLIDAPRTKAGLAHWKRFVAEVVERYGPRGSFWSANPFLPRKPVKAVQIWNEQNSSSFYGPRPNVRNYAKLLIASDQAIRSTGQNVKVILGGMFGTPQQGKRPSLSSWKFLRQLYKVKGITKRFDGIGVHPYASSMKKVRSQVDLLRREAKRARDPKAQMWVTELGWGANGPKHPLVKGKQGQAKRLKQAFRYFEKNRRRLNVQTVIWYSWRDNPDRNVGLCKWCPTSGLVTKDLRKKPSLKQFTKFTGGR